MQKIFLIFLVFLVVVSCEKKPTSARLILIDTLTGEYLYNNSVVFFDEKTNTEYLVNANTWENLVGEKFDSLKKRNFKFFTLDNDGDVKLEKTIYLDFDYNINDFLMHTLDSIYAISYRTKQLSLFNSEGNEVNYWDLDVFDDDSVIYLPTVSPAPIMNKGVLYFHLDPIRYDNYYKQKQIGMLQIEDGKIVKWNKIIAYPEYYQQEKKYLWHYSSFLIHKENELVISYGSSHNLYLYKNDSTYRTVDAKSKYLDTFRFRGEDAASEMKQQVEDGYYFKIIYDKYRNLYYRIVFHNQPYTNADGLVNNYDTHPWSIIVFDTNFNRIDEIFFSANEFCAGNLLVTSKGLILTKRDEGEGLFAQSTVKQFLFELILE